MSGASVRPRTPAPRSAPASRRRAVTPVPLTAGDRPPLPGALPACATFALRAVLKHRRAPRRLFVTAASAVLTTLTFTYVFGGALAGSPEEYLRFLLPGTMASGAVLATVCTGRRVNSDAREGVLGRFRTLPVRRGAWTAGCVLGETFVHTLVAVAVLCAGMAAGFRPEGGAPGAAAGIALLAVFSSALSWLWAVVGQLLPTGRAVTAAGLAVLVPLVFLSNVFVEPGTVPGWLRTFAGVNPVAHLVGAVRELMLGRWPGTEIGWTLAAVAVLVSASGALTLRLRGREQAP